MTSLTSTTASDLVAQTQTITFFQGVTQVDQLVFSSNQMTWQTTAGYTLSKADTILFNQFLSTYKTLLLIQFPTLYNSINTAFPFCTFRLNEINSSGLNVGYIQTSQTILILQLNYTPGSGTTSMAARTAFAISVQEFLYSVEVLNQFNQQVNLN